MLHDGWRRTALHATATSSTKATAKADIQPRRSAKRSMSNKALRTRQTRNTVKPSGACAATRRSISASHGSVRRSQGGSGKGFSRARRSTAPAAVQRKSGPLRPKSERVESENSYRDATSTRSSLPALLPPVLRSTQMRAAVDVEHLPREELRIVRCQKE